MRKTNLLLVVGTILFFGVSLFPKESSAFTLINSDITENTTWSIAGSPYVVDAFLDINVLEGASLTVDPGVVVKFDYMSGILVSGSLVVNGSALSPVYFTSFYDDTIGGDTNGDGTGSDPIEGDWDGIFFDNSSSSYINGTYIKYSWDPIVLENSTLDVNNTNISDQFSGVDVYSGSILNAFNLKISNTDLDDALSVFEDSFLNISNSKIFGSGVTAFNNSEIDATNLSIYDSFSSGIVIFNDSTLSSENIFIENSLEESIVAFNTSSIYISNSNLLLGFGGGVHFFNDTDVEIIDSVIQGFSGAGIFEGGKSGTYAENSLDLSNTSIVDSSQGIYFLGAPTITSNQNAIYRNDIGAESASLTENFLPNVWWGDSTGPYNPVSNPTGLGNSVDNLVDPVPWLGSNPLPEIDPLVLVNVYALGQFKYDGIASIAENGVNMGDNIILRARLNSDFGQAKIQFEVKESDVAFDGTVDFEVEFLNDEETAEYVLENISDGSYHWRARAVEEDGGESDWVEFGLIGNTDFNIHQVPHYTQNFSPYPSIAATDVWDSLDYAFGPLNTGCGASIAACGCAMTSGVMIARYYGITEVDGNNVDPNTLNTWLQNNNGYYPGGAINWLKVAEYTGNQIAYDNRSGDSFNNYGLLDEFLNLERPAIAKIAKGRGGSPRSHFIVISNKLADTYEVRDPAWYDTKTLNEPETIGKVRAYENGFDGLRLFKPGDGLAQSYFSANVASPAHLVVEDSLGRRVGYDPISGISYNEIPEASYVSEMYDDPEGTPSEHEWKIAYIPDAEDDEYKIYTIGTGSGSYTVGVSGNGGGGFDSDSESGTIEENEVIDYSANYSNAGGITDADIGIIPPDPFPVYPGSVISFNTSSKSLVIESDTIGTMVTSTATGYQLVDPEGDVTSFDLTGDYTPEVFPFNLTISNIFFGGVPNPLTGSLYYTWTTKPDGTIKMYKQTASISDGTYSTANYKIQKTTTTIWDTLPGGSPVKTILAGVVPLDINIKNDGTITVTH